MTTEIEQMLTRELDAVAGGVEVPPMPSLVPTETRPLVVRLWQPLLVAAAVVLIVGVLAVALSRQGGGTPQPAPAPGTPTATPTTGAPPAPAKGDPRIPVTPPTVPYVLDQQLYVDGAVVPGAWQVVESRGDVWLAQQYDGSWWWGGPGIDPGPIEAEIDQPPVLSPSGGFVAFIDMTGGTAHLTGFDTQPAGEGFGRAPIDLPGSEDGVPLAVRAVSDEGDVIVQGTRTSLMWRAQYADQRTVVDLAATAPDQVVLAGTAAGLVVVDGVDGATDATSTAPYLATISTDGALTREGPLPTYDDLEISPGGTWLVRAPAGTLGGEVPATGELRAQPVDSGDEITLTPPARWAFASNSWAWEDDETLVAVLVPTVPDGQDAPRLVRCSVSLEACRAFPGASGDGAGDGTTPGASEGATGAANGSYSAEQTLDAVVRAVVADDRAGLLDQAVVADGEWGQLVDLAGGGGAGAVPRCRDNGSGTRDCEIPFEADPSTAAYAILEPAGNAYGWRISYVGVGGA